MTITSLLAVFEFWYASSKYTHNFNRRNYHQNKILLLFMSFFLYRFRIFFIRSHSYLKFFSAPFFKSNNFGRSVITVSAKVNHLVAKMYLHNEKTEKVVQITCHSRNPHTN